MPEKTSFRYVYNGTPQSLAFREYDEAHIRLENNVQTNAGTYEVRAYITEPDLYTFRVDGEELDYISFEFVINKATPNFSSVAPEVVSFDGNTYSYDFEVLAGGPKYTVQYLYGTSFSEGADEERISVDGSAMQEITSSFSRLKNPTTISAMKSNITLYSISAIFPAPMRSGAYRITHMTVYLVQSSSRI